MATTRSKGKSNETLELVLVFGQKKLPMLVSLDGSERPGDCLTVGHLSDAVTEVSQVKPECQKLIHKGHTLFKNDREFMESAFGISLSSLGIKSGERIMLLGRKTTGQKPEVVHEEKKSPLNQQDSICRTATHETKAGTAPDRLAELRASLDGIGARLEQDLVSVTSIKNVTDMKSLRLHLRGLHEETMKLLEAVDSTTAQEHIGTSEAEFRTQRKALVNSIQSRLDQCENCLSDVTDKIKSLEQQQDQSGNS